MSSPLAVGLLRVVLHIPDSGSLKGKRQVISGLLRRVRSEFQVAAAEVGERDRWQLAELAVACVSADGRHVTQILLVNGVGQRTDALVSASRRSGKSPGSRKGSPTWPQAKALAVTAFS